MNPILRNILLVTVFSFALSFDGCYFGTAYDTYYRLYPEFNCTCTDCHEVYGMRWVYPGLVLSSGSLFALVIHFIRNGQAKHFHKLSIYKS
jgi:hypothetical protein